MQNFKKKYVILTTKIFVLHCLFFFSSLTYSQTFTNQRTKTFYNLGDTIKIDTLSIILEKFVLKNAENKNISPELYYLDFKKSTVFIKDSLNKIYTVEYSVYDIDFSKNYFNKDTSLIVNKLSASEPENFYILDNEKTYSFITSDELEKEGNISRGITVGNNQDLSLNSNLNLQLSGKLNEELSVIASITDENIPIQAEGNTQQIQDFDKVFINIFSVNTSIIVGDFEAESEENYFLEYQKKVKGIEYNFTNPENNESFIKLDNFSSGVALGKGNYNRMVFNGTEGNQGPYKLYGKNGESYVIVLSGSEKVYIDGVLQSRGENYDYIIDYNAAELTFTAKNLITKDKRIIVEFEYSEQNYSRFLFFNSTDFSRNNDKYSISIYSEKDNKNQPLQYDFSSQQINLLREIGDNIENAVTQKIDSVQFDNNKILYFKKDTLVENVIYNDVFVYSTNPENANYILSFSDVGPNSGNYVLKNSNVNGRIFEWIAPENNIPQGNYDPVILIITPKKKQIISLTGENNISEKSIINYELGISNNDINTFSPIDDNNNLGLSFKIKTENYIKGTKSSDNYLKSVVDYMFIGEKFNSLENFTEPEFERNWNISPGSVFKGHLTESKLIYKISNSNQISHSISYLNNNYKYSGILNNLTANCNFKNITFEEDLNILNSKDSITETVFLQNTTNLKRRFKYLNIGLLTENEYNKWNNTFTDSILFQSFKNNSYSVIFQNNDTSNNKLYAEYVHRNDFLPKKNSFYGMTTSDDYNFGISTNQQKANYLSINSTYRELQINDSSLTDYKPEKTLTGSLQYNLKLFKSAISSNFYVETSSGLEQKKEFLYIEVNQGEGIYNWIDYNSNNIKEISEFETANYSDEANYIKVYSQSNNYIKAYSSKISYTLALNPKKIWSTEKGLKKILALFSNNLAYKIEQKTMLPSFAMINDFYTNDTLIVSNSEIFRNLFSFNKNGILSFEYTIQKQKNKILQINGFDDKKNNYQDITTFLNFSDNYIFSTSAKQGYKIYLSEFFDLKNYNIKYSEYEVNTTLNQFKNVDFTLKYIFEIQNNTFNTEKSTGNNIGMELNYSLANNADILFRLNYINLKYNSDLNSSVAYVMLESLKPGNNFTWTLNLQKNIFTNLQLSVLYEGRYSEDSKIIHTGNLEIKAIF